MRPHSISRLVIGLAVSCAVIKTNQTHENGLNLNYWYFYVGRLSQKKNRSIKGLNDKPELKYKSHYYKKKDRGYKSHITQNIHHSNSFYLAPRKRINLITNILNSLVQGKSNVVKVI